MKNIRNQRKQIRISVSINKKTCTTRTFYGEMQNSDTIKPEVITEIKVLRRNSVAIYATETLKYANKS